MPTRAGCQGVDSLSRTDARPSTAGMTTLSGADWVDAGAVVVAVGLRERVEGSGAIMARMGRTSSDEFSDFAATRGGPGEAFGSVPFCPGVEDAGRSVGSPVRKS